MNKDICVGIDFGTTNSSIAWFNPKTGHAEALYNAEGELRTPSVVYVGSDEIIVGKLAEDRVVDARNHPRIIRAVKSDLASNRAWYIDGRKWTSTEIAAEIIKKLKRDAEETYFRCPVERAVFTHPAIFDEVEKVSLCEAAKLAGFREVVLMEEPVAAAIAYIQEGHQVTETVLVYDLGGGTLDLAFLVRTENDKSFRLAAPAMGKRIGGEVFDRLLYEEVDRFIREKMGGNSSSGTLDLELLARCRKYKENLSITERPSPLSWLASGWPDPILIEVRRPSFESLIRPYVDQTVEVANQLLRQAGQAGYEPDSLILIGGSSRIPLIQSRLQEVLGITAFLWDKADIAVALGAAYHAFRIWGTSKPKKESRQGLTQEERMEMLQLFDSEVSGLRNELVTLSKEIGALDEQQCYILSRDLDDVLIKFQEYLSETVAQMRGKPSHQSKSVLRNLSCSLRLETTSGVGLAIGSFVSSVVMGAIGAVIGLPAILTVPLAGGTGFITSALVQEEKAEKVRQELVRWFDNDVVPRLRDWFIKLLDE